MSLHSVDLTSSPLRSRSSSLSSAQFSAGVLHLRVHGARKLEKKGMFGKADPYILVTFGPTKAGAMFKIVGHCFTVHCSQQTRTL